MPRTPERVGASMIVRASHGLSGWGGLLGVVLATVLVAGCAQDKAKPLVIASARPPSASPAPSFSRQDPVQATLGFSYALGRAEETLDPNYPGLTTYGQSAAVADIRGIVSDFKRQGLRLGKPRVVTHTHRISTVIEKGRQVARVASCVTEPADDLVDVKSGKPRPVADATSQPVAHYVWVAIVGLMDDGWHVDGGTITDVTTCPFGA